MDDLELKLQEQECTKDYSRESPTNKWGTFLLVYEELKALSAQEKKRS
jgi:hypothetical protein